MPGVFTLIGQSWTFLQKQPALTLVGFWLIWLPVLCIRLLVQFLHSLGIAHHPENTSSATMAAIGILFLTVIIIWGSACVILIGKKLVSAKAGRSRSSFRAVRREARGFIIPLLLTAILRGIFTLLWSLLLIIPGIIYSIRTTFYEFVIIDEGIAYGKSLRRSIVLTRGETWGVFWRLIVLGVCLFVPITIIDAALAAFSKAPAALVGISIIHSLLLTVSLILLILSMLQMYGALKPATAPVMGKHRKK